MEKAKRIYGIDLGTTYSCIAHVDEHGKPVVIANAEGDLTTPSAVWFEEADNIVVGKYAKEQAVVRRDASIVEVKRVIGTSDWTTEQYGRSYGPSEISALILRKLVADAQTITGDTISDVVITCPAYFGRNRIEATRQAGQLAGLDVHFVIPEPTAAAIAYEMDQSSDQTLLVFDLGGGTFDISVIEIKKDGAITVICVGGDDHLGGTHWDQTVANWFATEIADAVGVDPDEVMEDAEVWQELLSTAEEAKIRLTSAKKFTGKVLYEADRVPLELSREKFDEITGQLLAKTISLTHEVISTARDKGHGQIDKVLLVGGSTYMPQIRERVESEFNMEVVQFDPNQAVAKGAARFGFMCQLDEQIKIGIAEETGQSVDDVDLEAVPEEVKSKVERDVANDYGLTLPGLQSMSKEISNVTAKSFGVVVLTGATYGVTGWGIAFYPQVENITGLTENYSVGFFTTNTQTFYEPYLETTYDDLIQDDRNIFYENKENRLYLYSYQFGNPQNFDELPSVDIMDMNGSIIFLDLPTCQITNGVYEVIVPPLTSSSIPCMMYDTWKNLKINGVDISNQTNEFVVNDLSELYQIGSTTNDPSLYGFDFFGIKQDEKILGPDVRKVNVIIKKAYTTNEVLNKVNAYYRVYVREGKTEVQVQDWTQLNRTPDSHYFIFNTEDKIPNEYFIDIKVLTDREINTYKRELKFQIVNRK